MILTWLLPENLSRPINKNVFHRRLQFLESVIDDLENGQSVYESFEKNWYPGLSQTAIEKFFYLSFSQGLVILPALREFLKECQFQIDRERAIDIEIAPIRATLKLLTYFPGIILIGAAFSNVMPLNKTLINPIPIAMILGSIALQIIGRRWSESIISHVKD
ncbi:MAG: hypothetical protein EBT44_04610 [Actinobacteria bacterium]|uniref:Type II secretion system protein GspF domain-containing protein n=1 Tax=Candidatus Fonsibacter lacus TaxID=2576439 RepID=A0A965GED4_9PROT|nr:hypothetical protein [Candidatus Fonsibacter lacus]